MRVAAGYADRIGLAFQIVDDVLDVAATEEQMGKSVGSDAGHNKNTFLSFCTVEQAIAEAERLSREAAELLFECWTLCQARETAASRLSK